MAILPILCYPDPRLHTVAKSVQQVDDRVRQLVSDMLETMYDAHGIGLAATQVDVHERVVVIDVSEERNAPLVLVNPEIVWYSPDRHRGDEGCLSVPYQYRSKVWRPNRVLFKATDLDGNPLSFEAEGFLAVCLQHEYDHLQGTLFLDHLSHLKRSMFAARVRKRGLRQTDDA